MDTCVGYSGGTKASPTYESIGDHTECVRVVYDPSVLSYVQLLDYFFDSHNPGHNNTSHRQYMNGVWTHTPEQAEALAAKVTKLEQAGRAVETYMAEATDFYRAEEYHQQFYEKQKTRSGDAPMGCGFSL